MPFPTSTKAWINNKKEDLTVHLSVTKVCGTLSNNNFEQANKVVFKAAVGIQVLTFKSNLPCKLKPRNVNRMSIYCLRNIHAKYRKLDYARRQPIRQKVIYILTLLIILAQGVARQRLICIKIRMKYTPKLSLEMTNQKVQACKLVSRERMLPKPLV